MPNLASQNAVDNRSKTRKGFGGIVKKSHEAKALRELTKKASLITKAVPNHAIDGTLFEDLLYASFEEIGCNVFSYSAHSPGSDLNIDGKDISCKTGKINKDGILSFSGSRLQKIIKRDGIFGACDYLDRIAPDYFAFFIPMKNEFGVTYYKLMIIPGKLFLFSETEWEGFDENGYLISDERSSRNFTSNGISGKLRITMSYQIWIDIDTNIHKPVFVRDIYPNLI